MAFLPVCVDQEVLHGFKVVLAYLRCRNCLVLQVSRGDQVALRQQVAWSNKECRQDKGDQESSGLPKNEMHI